MDKARFRVSAALLVVVLAVPMGAAADPVDDQNVRVRSIESRVRTLQTRLEALLGEVGDLDRQMLQTYGRLGATYLQLSEAEGRVDKAQRLFNLRTREAYKAGGLFRIKMLLGARDLPEFMRILRSFNSVIEADASAHRRLLDERKRLRRQYESVDATKSGLLKTTGRMGALRSEVQTLLGEELSELHRAKADLGRLEAERRARVAAAAGATPVRVKWGPVSPEVEARRTTRQKVLDVRLAALLDWYAPGTGPEPFMPPRLRSSGIVTTGQSSWYGPGFHLRRASSGATYRMEQLTAASPVLPFGTLLKVTYAGRAVVVVITDRGPFVPGRVLDLSWAASQAIGLTGVKSVRMEILVANEAAPPFP